MIKLWKSAFPERKKHASVKSVPLAFEMIKTDARALFLESEISKAPEISNAPEISSHVPYSIIFQNPVFFANFQNNLSSLRQLVKRATQGYPRFFGAT